MDTSPSPYRGSTRRKREHRQPAFQTYLAGKPHSYLRFYFQFCFHSCSHFCQYSPSLLARHSWPHSHVGCKQAMACSLVCLSVFVFTAPQYFRPIPAQYIPGGGAVYWPSHPQMYPSGPFIPQARPGGVGPMFIPSGGAYPVYMPSQPSPSLSPAHRGQPQPAMFLGPAPGALGQYYPAQGSPGVVQLGKVRMYIRMME